MVVSSKRCRAPRTESCGLSQPQKKDIHTKKTCPFQGKKCRLKNCSERQPEVGRRKNHSRDLWRPARRTRYNLLSSQVSLKNKSDLLWQLCSRPNWSSLGAEMQTLVSQKSCGDPRRGGQFATLLTEAKLGAVSTKCATGGDGGASLRMSSFWIPVSGGEYYRPPTVVG